MQRYLHTPILRDLQTKMVLVSGPRQCGKTTLAKILAQDKVFAGHTRYFNWDARSDQRRIIGHDWSDDTRLVIFDEIHKYSRWKGLIKGFYDTRPAEQTYLVTGSAHLNVFHRGGDAMVGRFHHWRLHPFDLAERPAKMSLNDAFDRLMRLGGFPEPFLGNDERAARRWRAARTEQVLSDDMRDLTLVRELSSVSLLLDLLAQRVGSPVVMQHLALDLQVSSPSIKNWIELLEHLYLLFAVKPYTVKLPRAVRKPPKVYFYDNGDVVGDDGARFENLVATHLLKRCHYLSDATGHRYELHYVRDKEGREVDFVITRNRQVDALYEAKLAETRPSPTLVYYAEKLKPKRAVQLVAKHQPTDRRGKLELKSFLDEFATLAAPA